MEVHVDIGGSELLCLKGALLVYQGTNRGFVSWHEIRQASDGGAPFLGEAQAVTTEFVKHLAQGLGSRVPTEILPENVLVRTAEAIAWWTPAMTRTMFFAASAGDAAGLSGKRFPQPPLVWKVKESDLWVRALPENCRPVAETKLMVAPYWNVDGETGWTCQGSMRSPNEAGVVAIGPWEQAFFESEFTHQTGVRRLTTHPGGFLGLWSSLAGRRGLFPVEHLTPAKESLHDFVARS